MKFNERLKALRKRAKLTQTELGNILGYGYTAISNYESGRNEPSISDLIKLATFFKVSVDYLLCVTEDPAATGVDEENAGFFELKSVYSRLDEDRRNELKYFMDWLEYKQCLETGAINDLARMKAAVSRGYYEKHKAEFIGDDTQKK